MGVLNRAQRDPVYLAKPAYIWYVVPVGQGICIPRNRFSGQAWSTHTCIIDTNIFADGWRGYLLQGPTNKNLILAQKTGHFAYLPAASVLFAVDSYLHQTARCINKLLNRSYRYNVEVPSSLLTYAQFKYGVRHGSRWDLGRSSSFCHRYGVR